ncbi:MAG: YfcE family phosphodiesterase [Candidatus Moranbacteria bacterium]|nr:YfcE family phosphodiesterase [Candidatus Moranbacteria bacterium]
MKIAVISDIHDNFHNMVCAVEEIEKRDVEYVLCLGDLVANGIAKILAKLNVPVLLIWGNNIGDKVQVMNTAFESKGKLTVSEKTYDSIELGGRKLFLSHYPDLANPIAASGEFDAVFFGHTHKKSQEKLGDCLVLNPGEIGTMVVSEASFAVYDTKTNEAEFVVLDDTVVIRTDKVEEYMKNIF